MSNTYIPKKYQNRIDSIEHDEDGWWIYLKNGFYWDDYGLHIIHEYTKAEAIKMLKLTEVCNCEVCQSGGVYK